MSKKSKQTYFQDGWLSSEEFKAWLCKASTKGEARCRLCQTNMALSNMGIRALRSHAGNKSLVKKVKVTYIQHLIIAHIQFFEKYSA